MHRQQSYLTLALVVAACGCSLVIGDIPPAAKGDASQTGAGGQAGALGSGGEPASDGQGGATGSNSASSGGRVGVGAGGQGGDSSDGTAQTSTTSGHAGGEGGAAPETSASSGGTGASPGSGGTGASPGSGGTSTCKDACDCDGDGALSEACQGDDCDDNDPLAYPSQKSFFATPRGAAGFDYNCDGQSERQFDAATKCGALLSCSEGASDGFLGTLPACGETGTWGRCKVDGLLCVDEVIENARTMLCR